MEDMTPTMPVELSDEDKLQLDIQGTCARVLYCNSTYDFERKLIDIDISPNAILVREMRDVGDLKEIEALVLESVIEYDESSLAEDMLKSSLQRIIAGCIYDVANPSHADSILRDWAADIVHKRDCLRGDKESDKTVDERFI